MSESIWHHDTETLAITEVVVKHSTYFQEMTSQFNDKLMFLMKIILWSGVAVKHRRLAGHGRVPGVGWAPATRVARLWLTGSVIVPKGVRSQAPLGVSQGTGSASMPCCTHRAEFTHNQAGMA
jgi:hypothetical protein